MLVIHLASMADSQLEEEEMLNASVTPGYLKLSIGKEREDNMIEGIKQLLEKIIKTIVVHNLF